MSSQSEAPDNLQEYVKLMTDHQGNLRAFIVSLMPGSPDVADVLQETNAALWLKRSCFEHGTNFIAWAFKIARYEVMRQRDRTKRLGRIVFSDEMIEMLTERDVSDKPDARLAALDNCLQKLTEDQRRLLEERYTPGHSLEKYAVDTGQSAGSLRMALLRVRGILKDCIEKTLSIEAR
jgi:RNA polymerase sigma-70 factor (ECF subfamily)